VKVVILAGGQGTRLAEETDLKPKPMVEVGGWPILWHIMKHYACYGHREFFIALGYRGDVIKRFFVDYSVLNGDMTIDLASGEIGRASKDQEKWLIHMVDTGGATMTGGRIKRLEPWIGHETFLATYGDGVSDVDLEALVRFHKVHGKLATVTAVRPPARFGGLVLEGDLVVEFTEKPQIGEGWINGGFMVFEQGIYEYLSGDETVLESQALERLASQGQLAAYRHEGFWQCMDTLRDKRLLEGLWQQGKAPWRLWG